MKIKDENAGNAIRMLEKDGTFLGWIGDIRYYVLDGKAWSVCTASYTPTSGEVHILEEDWTNIRDAIAALEKHRPATIKQTCF